MTDHDLSGYLSQHVIDELHNTSSFSLGAERFRMAYAEEAAGLGWDEDDPALLIRRESDGALFEVELEATVTPARPRQDEPPFDENHYRYHTPNQPLESCAWCKHLGWAES